MNNKGHINDNNDYNINNNGNDYYYCYYYCLKITNS